MSEAEFLNKVVVRVKNRNSHQITAIEVMDKRLI